MRHIFKSIRILALTGILLVFQNATSIYSQSANSGLDKKVTLRIEGLKLSEALKMLALQYKLNMVVSDAEKVSLSLFLDNVVVSDALEAMLYPNGYTYYVKGDLIVVGPAGESTVGSMSVLLYRLNYLSGSSAKKAVAVLISDFGSVELIGEENGDSEELSGASSAVLIRDYPVVLKEVKALLDEIDIRQRMVMIEVKMIETKIDSKDIVGFNFSKSLKVKLEGDNRGVSASSNTTSSTSINSGTNNSRAGFIDLHRGRWTWGTLSVEEVSLTLDYLLSTGKSKLISNPKLSTLENHQAEFNVATVVPVQTINRFNQGVSTADIVTFQDIAVGISLLVLPRINDSGIITMDVLPRVEEIIGFSGTADQQKPITTERSVRTTVTCANNETVVIGGLLKESEIISTEKVFFLGDIPILGALFRHKRTETETTDLIIMITPTILR